MWSAFSILAVLVSTAAGSVSPVTHSICSWTSSPFMCILWEVSVQVFSSLFKLSFLVEFVEFSNIHSRYKSFICRDLRISPHVPFPRLNSLLKQNI